jgi:alkylhydroperoxidase family enzyme
MLGRSVGLSTEQLNHLGDDPLPDGVYSESESAIVRYAQRSTSGIFIDDETYEDLAKHFTGEQMVEICLVTGLSNVVNRFHATFLTDVDEETIETVAAGDAANGACTLPRPAARRE